MPIKVDKLAGPKGGDESRRLAQFWRDQIDHVKEASEIKHWVKRGEAIEKRYRDVRSRIDEEGQRHYNSLWSNVEILKPALFGKIPVPIVERRFKDKDPVGRGSAQILERALRNEIEVCGYDMALQQAVSDYLLPGRGTVWVRYEPEIEEGISLPMETQTDMRDAQGTIGGESSRDERVDEKPERSEVGDSEQPTGSEQSSETDQEPTESEEETKLQETGDRIVRESTPVDFVPWQDFFTLPVRARTWAEVTAVAKRIYMSRNQMKKRFGKAIGGEIPLQRDDRGLKAQSTALRIQDEDKGEVYEIWNRDDETVYWVAHGYDYLCDIKDDPLELENFFPTPKPLYSNATNNTLVPVPDYIQYQDQAIQIDELSQRIAMLAKACKVAGVYNAAAKDIQRLLNESVENELIPVDDWAAFAEKGGVEGNISLLPVKDIIGVINELMVVKQKQIEEMDRLTGINDIMRGTSDARETLGGVRLKHNATGTRLSARQNEVARFCRDVVRLMADIMCQHFSPQSLIEVSGALYEEGLGPDDMPPLSALQNSAPAQKAPGLPAPSPPPVSPAAPGGNPPSQGQPPQQPQGQNVVPFRPAQLPQMSGGQPPPPPQGMPPSAPQMPAGPPQPQIPPEVQAKIDALQRITKAISLLRDERLRGFRVDIEIDSTIFPDAQQEKQDRTEFITAITTFLQQAMMMGMQMPESIPMLAKMLQFGVRGYRVGRDLEQSIEEFCDQAAGMAGQMRQQMSSGANNAEQMKLQIEQLKASAQLQSTQQKAEADQQKAQFEMQKMTLEDQVAQKRAQAEIDNQQMESQTAQQQAQADIAMKQMDIRMREMEMEIEKMRMGFEAKKMQQQSQQAETQNAMDMQRMHHESQQAGMQHQQAGMAHEQSVMEHHRAMTQPQQQSVQGNTVQRPKQEPKVL